MRTYSELKEWLKGGLSDDDKYRDVAFWPGPNEENAPDDRFVMLTRVGGPGHVMEQIFDAVGWQVMCAGTQESFDDAELLALRIDALITSATSQDVEGIRLVTTYRQGSPPIPLTVDDANRTRFVCSYIFEVESYAA